MASPAMKIFRYLEDLDCFVVREEYRKIADQLGLLEWHPVVWIGRLFTLDNDFGEHWFDNWELREQLKLEAEKRGISYEDLMIIDPDHFQNGDDGPYHTPEQRKKFWTDVLKSLELSYDLIFAEARFENAKIRETIPDMFIADLEQRIERISKEIRGTSES
ncbi:MAG: hypothetical protein HY327_01085 [Chloroflexi bacterium]|nr:hypothetical protein [Chloroflexota bacterium]